MVAKLHQPNYPFRPPLWNLAYNPRAPVAVKGAL